MVESAPAQLDAVFHALADPTRRAMLRRLSDAPLSVGELAAPHAMSLAAASKHIKTLERAGLVRRKVQGRTHVCALDTAPLGDADEWLAFYRRFWTEQLDRLDDLLAGPDAANPGRPAMTATTTLKTLRMVRRFEAPPERVFDAWTDPHLAAAWLFTGPESTAHSTTFDLRVGGLWEVVDRRDGTDYRAIGEYLEIERPRRLVFTFGMPQFSPGFARVTVEIAPDGAGAVMTLVQEDVPPEAVPGLEEGWAAMFDALARQLGAGA